MLPEVETIGRQAEALKRSNGAAFKAHTMRGKYAIHAYFMRFSAYMRVYAHSGRGTAWQDAKRGGKGRECFGKCPFSE